MSYRELSKEEHEELMQHFIKIGINPNDAGQRVAMVMAIAERKIDRPVIEVCRELFYAEDYDKAAFDFIQRYADK